MAGRSAAVDTCAHDHDIVHNREADFASDPFALTISDSAVDQHCSLVLLYSSLVKTFGDGQVILGEEIPYRAVDNLARSVAEDVDD